MIQKWLIKLFFVALIGLVIIFIIYPYTKNLTTVRNTKRKADLLSLSQALSRYYTDHKKHLFNTLPVQPVEICRFQATDCRGLIDLSFIVTDNYISRIPEDPAGSLTENGTGYFIYLTSEHRIRLDAPTTDLAEPIGISTHSFFK